MKFKVGDKVRIIKNLRDSEYNKLIGIEFFISKLDESDVSYYWNEEDTWWSEEELELVEEGVKKMKINEIFEKNDINARYEFDGFVWMLNNGKYDLIGINSIGERILLSEEYSVRDILEAEFTEIERKIDWTKVPKGTMIKVRDYEEDIWDEKQFVDCMSEREGLNFLIKEKGRWVCYDCATIDNPKEEWYK